MCPVPPRFFFLFSACVTDGHSFRTHSSPGNEGAVINISALGPLAAGETRKGGGREQQKWRGPLHRLKRKGGRPLRFFFVKKGIVTAGRKKGHTRAHRFVSIFRSQNGRIRISQRDDLEVCWRFFSLFLTSRKNKMFFFF